MIPALAAFMAGGAPPINILDSFADTGATDEASAGSFSVSSGKNRMLVKFLQLTGSTDNVTGITYGGQAMTEQVAIASGGGFPARVKIWTLDEAGIAAASGTSFGVTGGTNGSWRSTAVALENVDQTTPVVDSGSGIVDSGNPADVTLTTEAGGYAAAGLMVDISVTGNNTWASPFTERVDVETSASGNSYSSADTLTDGSNVTADPTTNGSNEQQCQAAISFRPAA